MQRTLFDFARTSAKAQSSGAAAAGTAAARSKRPSSLSSSPARSPSTSPTRKHARRRDGRAASAGQTGAMRGCPIEVEERSRDATRAQDGGVLVEAHAAPEFISNVAPTDSGVVIGASGHSSQRVPRASASLTAPAAPGGDVAGPSWLADLLTNAEWRDFLSPITAASWHKGEFGRIERFLDAQAAAGKVVLPPRELIFSAFNSCPFKDLKVVLLGQDPYHNVNQAHGLCFSVLPGVSLPPSLRNMYKELVTDVPGFQAPTHGYLQSWCAQGMLLLNATLTVEAHCANSHSKTSGWPHFTDAVIAHLSAHHPNRLVFLLWGNYAQQKKKLIDTRRHVVLESVHPSPLSASKGWFGCHCFSKCNTALREMGHEPMHWQLPLHVPNV